MNKGYIRVSTIRQADNGVSLQTQRETILAKAKGEVQFFKDSKSGRTRNRPGLKELEKSLRRGDIIFVYKLDRLSRGCIDTIKLKNIFDKKEVELVSCTEPWDTRTPIGKLFFRNMASYAEYESDLISERTKEAMRTAKSNGSFLGTIPFGYSKKKGKLFEIESEQATIKLAARLRKKGYSYDKIARRFNDELIPSKKGCLWYGDVIGHILRGDRERKDLMGARV